MKAVQVLPTNRPPPPVPQALPSQTPGPPPAPQALPSRTPAAPHASQTCKGLTRLFIFTVIIQVMG